MLTRRLPGVQLVVRLHRVCSGALADGQDSLPRTVQTTPRTLAPAGLRFAGGGDGSTQDEEHSGSECQLGEEEEEEEEEGWCAGGGDNEQQHFHQLAWQQGQALQAGLGAPVAGWTATLAVHMPPAQPQQQAPPWPASFWAGVAAGCDGGGDGTSSRQGAAGEVERVGHGWAALASYAALGSAPPSAAGHDPAAPLWPLAEELPSAFAAPPHVPAVTAGAWPGSATPPPPPPPPYHALQQQQQQEVALGAAYAASAPRATHHTLPPPAPLPPPGPWLPRSPSLPSDTPSQGGAAAAAGTHTHTTATTSLAGSAAYTPGLRPTPALMKHASWRDAAEAVVAAAEAAVAAAAAAATPSAPQANVPPSQQQQQQQQQQHAALLPPASPVPARAFAPPPQQTSQSPPAAAPLAVVTITPHAPVPLPYPHPWPGAPWHLHQVPPSRPSSRHPSPGPAAATGTAAHPASAPRGGAKLPARTSSPAPAAHRRPPAHPPRRRASAADLLSAHAPPPPPPPHDLPPAPPPRHSNPTHTAASSSLLPLTQQRSRQPAARAEAPSIIASFGGGNARGTPGLWARSDGGVLLIPPSAGRGGSASNPGGGTAGAGGGSVVAGGLRAPLSARSTVEAEAAGGRAAEQRQQQQQLLADDMLELSHRVVKGWAARVGRAPLFISFRLWLAATR